MSDEVDTLYDKYMITKRDGSPIDFKAQYFVLRLDSDSCAREAAHFYAACIKEKQPGLASELHMLVRKLSEKYTGGRDE